MRGGSILGVGAGEGNEGGWMIDGSLLLGGSDRPGAGDALGSGGNANPLPPSSRGGCGGIP